MRAQTKADWLTDWRVWLTIIILVTLAMICLTWLSWKWLYSDALNTATDSAKVSNGEVLRNAGFLIGGVLALVFALWRALVATRQTEAAHGQAQAAMTQAQIAQRQSEIAQQQSEIAQQQVETARQTVLNERYRRGTEMLGNDVLSVRVAGADELQHLAEDHPEQYHVQVMRLLCAFIRNPPHEDRELSKSGELRPDVQAAISAIGKRSEAAQRLEGELRLDLSGAHLDNANMWGLNLSRADLPSAHLSGATLINANLSNANLMSANFSGAVLMRANLSGAILMRANFLGARLQEANFSGALLQGAIMSGAMLGGESMPANLDDAIHPGAYVPISQRQLDQTEQDSDPPPTILGGSTDPETGEPLVWRGQPFNPQY